MIENARKCPRCGAENPTEAKFCSNCGAALAAAPEFKPSPSPSSFSSGFGARGGFGASRGRGNTRSVDLGVAPDRALAAFAQAVVDNGGEIIDHSQNQLTFVTPYKDMWTTSGMTVKLDGEIRITPGDQGGSHIMIMTGANIGSMMLLFVASIIIGLLLFGFGVIIGALLSAYFYFKVNGEIADRLARAIIERATALANSGQ